MACAVRISAIECDGRSHYLSIVGVVDFNVENGPTKAKRRPLQQLVWNVINLNGAEAVHHQVNSRWVRGKLAEAGVEV